MLSFAISLRVGSANDRFNEGRKAWSYSALVSPDPMLQSTDTRVSCTVTLGCRNMAFLIWLHAPATTLSAANLLATGPEQLETEKLKGLMEKRTMINLLEAFAVACKVSGCICSGWEIELTPKSADYPYSTTSGERVVSTTKVIVISSTQ